MKTSFENLFVWQEARELVKLIYRIMEVCRDWGFKDQIQRAAVSIMNNIAEVPTADRIQNTSISSISLTAVAPRSEVWLICVRIYESAVQKMQRTFGANHE